jgi:hypothetical protein
MIYEYPAITPALTQPLPFQTLRTLGEVGRAMDALREDGADRADLAALAKEAEVSRRRGQFRVVTICGLTIGLHLPTH